VDIGERIRVERARRGIEQGELARRAGIDPSHLYRIEHGKAKRPSHEVVASIASALGCTVAELAGEEPATPLTPAQKRWLGLLDLLPPARVPDAYAQVARFLADMEVSEDFIGPDDARELARAVAV
jgi:transcriptional regulator with XRE-family HTH domain